MKKQEKHLVLKKKVLILLATPANCTGFFRKRNFVKKLKHNFPSNLKMLYFCFRDVCLINLYA